MSDDKNDMPAAMRNEGYLDLRELIQRFDEMGELARVDGADWNLEIGALSETVAAADPASGLTDEELGERVEEMLRYDRGFQRSWRDGGGRQWHMIFTEWEPKRMSLHYAQPHLPEQCQRMIGREIVSKSELRKAEANGVTIAYNIYKIRAGADEFYLMYVINDDRVSGEEVTVERATPANRMKAVMAGRRNMGQRSMQLALVGEPDAEVAEQAMLELLPQLVVPASAIEQN